MSESPRPSNRFLSAISLLAAGTVATTTGACDSTRVAKGGAGGANGGATGVDSPDFHAGSRLTFPFFRTADGVIQRRGDIYDVGRGEACQVTRAADDLKRCQPDPLTFASDFFADAGCAQPLGEGGADDGVPYVKFYLSTAACEGTSLIELHERLS